MIGKRVSAAFIGKAVVASAVLALVACGGGGGGGSSSSSTTTGSSGGSSSSGGTVVITNYAAGGSLSLYSGSLGGYGYANGSGSAARFDEAFSIARDSVTGDMYVADYFSHTIRKVTAAGVVTTFAGRAYEDRHVDGSLDDALFLGPTSIALSNGTLYVSSRVDHTVRKIANGVVSTIAGSTNTPGNADGGVGVARFNSPQGLVVDSFGNLFVADTDNHTIRKITGTAVSTHAGSASFSGNVDGSSGSARFDMPTALAVDSSNNLYVGDKNGIRKITAAGIVTTRISITALVAGCNGGGTITALAVDANSNIYASSYARICKVAANGTVSFVAGNTLHNVVDGIGAAASVYNAGMIINAAGDTLYLADRLAVRKLDTASATVSTIAGKGFGDRFGYLDGAIGAAQYKQPFGITADATGRLIFTEFNNNALRRIENGVVSTLAGSSNIWTAVDGTGAAASFKSTGSVTVDASGNTYIVDGYAIRKVTPAGVVTTLAGNAAISGNTDGVGSAARFSNLQGLAVDSYGNVYVAEGENNNIRKITQAGVVTTFAGSTTGQTGSVDGSGTAARFNQPIGIVIDASNNLYVTDALNRTVRKITPAGMVSTYAGSAGVIGYVDGALSASRFGGPSSIAIDTTGNLYVFDYVNGAIRKISTTGPVTTVVGSSTKRWIVETGNLPGNLNAPRAMTVIGKKLYMTEENAILVADLP